MPEPADIIIVNATILPMGGAATIRNGVLKITGDSITGLGPANSFDISAGKKRIDAAGAVVMPGFVNCHTHIASNMLLRGLLEDVQLFEWLSTMWRLKRNFDAETLYWEGAAQLNRKALSFQRDLSRGIAPRPVLRGGRLLDPDIAQVERLAGLDGELLADRGTRLVAGHRVVDDAIGRAGDQGGEYHAALSIGHRTIP